MAHDLPLFRHLRVLALILIAGYFMIPAARAEGGCPDGSFPIGGGSAGWQGCAPMGGGQEEEESEPEEVWETRWGAIAIGDGGFGAVEGAKSKDAATAIALERCQNMGPDRPCWIQEAYYDQCVALAWGDHGAVGFHGPDLEENKREAVKLCQNHPDTNCKLYYSACSLPERVQ